MRWSVGTQWGNSGGSAYGYEKRVEHDGNGEHFRGLQQIVPTEAAVVVRIFEDYAAGLSPSPSRGASMPTAYPRHVVAKPAYISSAIAISWRGNAEDPRGRALGGVAN